MLRRLLARLRGPRPTLGPPDPPTAPPAALAAA
jgi:hypothetical protein